MAIGNEDPLEVARRKRFLSRFTYPAVSQFGPAGAVASTAALPFSSPNPTPNPSYQPGSIGSNVRNTVGANFSNPYSSMFAPQQPQGPATSSRSFVNGGYQFPAGSVLPSGFRENGGGGLTPGTPTATRFSTQPFLNGGYTFPAGSPLPEGFQENGGGGLTRQIPQENNTTTHFLPPGFTATTGSTGAQGSSPNDIHFLPPGFTSIQGTTNPQNQQLQFQPPQQQQNQFQGLPSVLDMLRKNQGDYGY